MKYDRDVFAPARRGEWSLPPQLVEARAVLTRVSEALASVEEPPPPQQPLDRAVTAALTAEHPGNVDVSGVVSHQWLVAERDARVQVLTTAQQRAEAELNGLLTDHCDDVIAHVRQAGEQLWTEITKRVADRGDIDTADSNALLRSSDRVRKSWLLLEDLAAKYGRTRQAIDRVQSHAHSHPEHDVEADHSEFEAGLCTIIGPTWRPSPISPVPQRPWPADSRSRLVWLIRAGIHPWWPTASQRDEAWMAAHGEGYAAMQQQQQRHRTARAWALSFS